jgi:hypothetical protein
MLTKLTSIQVARLLFIGAVCIVLSVAGYELIEHLARMLDLEHLVGDDGVRSTVLVFTLLIYVVLLACPFVPGAEIGMALLIMFGADVAPMVYLATVLGLCISYCVGRLVPERIVQSVTHHFGLEVSVNSVADRILQRASNTTDKLRPLSNSMLRWTDRISRFRGLTLAVLVNTPGNSLIGGDGGIAFAVGIGRFLSFRQFLVSIVFAVAPVPATILVLSLLSG